MCQLANKPINAFSTKFLFLFLWFQITFHNEQHNGQMLVDLQSYITVVDCNGTIISDSELTTGNTTHSTPLKSQNLSRKDYSFLNFFSSSILSTPLFSKY